MCVLQAGISAAFAINICQSAGYRFPSLNTDVDKQRTRALRSSLVSCRMSVLFVEKRNGATIHAAVFIYFS